MGVILAFIVMGVPCAVFLIYCATPRGRHWLRQNNMI